MIIFAYWCKRRHRKDKVEFSESGDLQGLGGNQVEGRDGCMSITL